MDTILVTGGMGFIGSHTVVQLLNNGYKVVILDNLSNASIKVLDRIKTITKKEAIFYQGDVRDNTILKKIFQEHCISSVLHFAGLKAVGESVEKPILYYDNNIAGTLVLLEAMKKAGVKNIVFSSSATVYGDPAIVPIDETAPIGNTTNPYGTSKYMIERILEDVYIANQDWSMTILRYFNPIGAHESGLMGEDPNGIPNNLMPYICQVAVGKLKQLSVFGDDYPTPDGTGVRDYIHVVDLAEGHLCAMRAKQNHSGVHIYNLGTGIGYSVLDIVKTFEKATGITVPYQIIARRKGDIATCYANPEKVAQEIHWQAKHTLKDMMTDAWHWQEKNPNGYQ